MLNSLPTELVDVVINHLDTPDRATLRLTCHRLHNIATPRVWKHLVLICGLHTQDEYRAELAQLSSKIFDRLDTLIIDVENVARFAEAVATSPTMMNTFRSVSLVQFNNMIRNTTLFGSKNAYTQEKKALTWLACNLHAHVNPSAVVKVYCEPIESAIVNEFQGKFGRDRIRYKYVIRPFREYLDDVATAHSMYVFWSAETVVPLNASFVSDTLTKVTFLQDDGVTSAPYDVKLLKEMFAGCANLVKMVLNVHLIDEHATTDWIPQSVRHLHLLGRYDSLTSFNAEHVESLKVNDTAQLSAMNIKYRDNVSVHTV